MVARPIRPQRRSRSGFCRWVRSSGRSSTGLSTCRSMLFGHHGGWSCSSATNLMQRKPSPACAPTPALFRSRLAVPVLHDHAGDHDHGESIVLGMPGGRAGVSAFAGRRRPRDAFPDRHCLPAEDHLGHDHHCTVGRDYPRLEHCLRPAYGLMGAATSNLAACVVRAGLAYVISQRLYYLPFELCASASSCSPLPPFMGSVN